MDKEPYIIYDENDEITAAKEGKLHISASYFLDNNLKSYKYEPENIDRQFSVDCPRNTTLISGNYADEIYFKNQFKFLEDKIVEIIDGKTFNLLLIIKMILTQSSYATPYFIFHKMFADGITTLLCSDNNNRVANIYYDKDNDNKLTFKLSGQFKVLDLTTDPHQVKSIVKFDMKLCTNIVDASYYYLYLFWYENYVVGNKPFTDNITLSWNLTQA